MLYTFIRNAAAISENVSHFTWTINYAHRTRWTDRDFFQITVAQRGSSKDTTQQCSVPTKQISFGFSKCNNSET